MVDSSDLGDKDKQVHVWLDNPPFENPWYTLGDYKRDKRRGAISFWSQLAGLVIAVITIVTVGSKAVTAFAEMVNVIKEGAGT